MAIIERVKINGFWGDRDISVDMKKDVNFLIGQNGSGKTTLIDSIAAVLTCDLQTLDRLPFDDIEITFLVDGTRKKPSVKVRKLPGEVSPYPEIEYSIKKSASATPRRMSLVDLAEERYLRGEPQRIVRTRANARRFNRDLVAQLEELVSVSWLSIHRSVSGRGWQDRPGREYSVDAKLEEISERLVRYFSSLATEAATETRKFQRKLFLSFIEMDPNFRMLGDLSALDIDKEKDGLVDVYKRFEVPESEYLKKTNRFFDNLNDLKDDHEKDSYKVQDLISIVNGWRVHSLIQSWTETLEEERKILEARDTFLEIANKMLRRKKAIVLKSNEVAFESDSGKSLKLSDLSSGEKQLFIILAEALLQRSSQAIYIADEPELSLHINWQEALVDNLITLNPNCQIIFATHSPDIVSHFSDFVIDMEKII